MHTDTAPATNGYLLHIGPVEIVASHRGGYTTVRTATVEPHRVATRYVIDFERVFDLERAVDQGNRLADFRPRAEQGRAAVGHRADKARLDAELARMSLEAMHAYGQYRAAILAARTAEA